jgi:siroheme synthase-like protein
VAARKARGLAACGALVTVVAPELAPEMEELVPRLHAVERRPYASGDAARFRLVVTATGDADVDASVYADADAAGVWVNSADDRDHSSFILPAVHRDGAVTVAVSTGGLSPALASWLRNRLAAACGQGMGTLAHVLGEARARLRAEAVPVDSVDWVALLDGPLPALVAAGDLDNAMAIMKAATSA